MLFGLSFMDKFGLRYKDPATVSDKPGISTEFYYHYIVIVSLSESTEVVAGLKTESKDIRSHIFNCDEFSNMISSGSINIGPAILLGLWLSNHRKRLKNDNKS